MIRGEHLPCPPHPRLHFVDDEEDPVLGRQLAQAVQERRGRNEISALSLDWLDDDGRDFVGRNQMGEELVFDVREALCRGGVRAGGAVGVWIRRVIHAGHERTEPAPLDGLTGGERQRSHRASVKSPQKRDDARPLRVIARELERGFGRLGAGVGEKRPDVALDGRDGRELFGQPDLRFVVEVRPRHVDELLRLLGNGLDDFRVADAGRIDGYAGGAIEEAIAVDVFDHRAFAARDDERIVPRV